MRKPCPHCINGMLNECEPCPYPENHGYSFQIVITDELFEVSDNPNYIEKESLTEQSF